VLLRGLTRDARHWGGVPEQLRERLAGHRVECLDLPGNGALATEPSPWRILDYVAACRRQASERGIAAPLHLVALSLGGMVALEWARSFPADVASCLLVNTSLRPLAPLSWRLRPRAWPSLVHALASRGLEARERDILRLTSRRYLPSEADGAALANEWVGLQQVAPVSYGNALRQLIAAARFGFDHVPPVPVLLLASTRDRLVDVRCSRAAAARWDCQLVEHPSAGHDVPLDDPAWFVERTAAWVACHEKP
jgi:pimeloyl-ACP methyl ester carboxylesterase